MFGLRSYWLPAMQRRILPKLFGLPTCLGARQKTSTPSLICLLLVSLASGAWADDKPLVAEDFPAQPEPRIEPPRSIDPIYLPSEPNASTSLRQDEDSKTQRLALRLTLDLPLTVSRESRKGLGLQGSRTAPPSLQLSLRYNPLSYWFGEIVLYRYLIAGRQRPWDPDFVYSFGYDDWHPGTFNVTYSNYAGNRLNPDASSNERFTDFRQGTWSVGYRFEVPDALRDTFLVGDGDQAICNAKLNLTPRYSDVNTADLQRNKRSGALECRYTRPSGWYAHATVFAYPDRGQQQPWDPDFTYGLGYTSAVPGGLSIQYSNYSGNRFKWRSSSNGDGGFRNGSLSLSTNIAW